MNIIKTLEARIESRLKETATPCKNYATEAAAEKATAKMAKEVGEHHNTEPANYVVFFMEDWGRWVGAIDLTGTINRKGACGGYLGLAGQAGFYTF